MVAHEEPNQASTTHGAVTCTKCKTAHPEDTDQAEFIAWHGHCAVCELTDMDAALKLRTSHG